jgi:hypothetical protein
VRIEPTDNGTSFLEKLRVSSWIFATYSLNLNASCESGLVKSGGISKEVTVLLA